LRPASGTVDVATAWVANVDAAVRELRGMPWLGGASVVGLLYDIETGLVEIIDDGGLAVAGS
jgi:carbonic anhydrase